MCWSLRLRVTQTPEGSANPWGSCSAPVNCFAMPSIWFFVNLYHRDVKWFCDVSQFGSPDVSIWCLIMVHQVMNDNISTPLQGFQQIPKVPFFVKNGFGKKWSPKSFFKVAWCWKPWIILCGIRSINGSGMIRVKFGASEDYVEVVNHERSG